MSKTRISFFIEPELQQGLRALKARDGVAEAESIRRAIAAYLRAKGISVGATPTKRGAR